MKRIGLLSILALLLIPAGAQAVSVRTAHVAAGWAVADWGSYDSTATSVGRCWPVGGGRVWCWVTEYNTRGQIGRTDYAVIVGERTVVSVIRYNGYGGRFRWRAPAAQRG